MNIFPGGSGGSSTAGGGLPVGSIVQAPYNLTDPSYLPCDGRKVLRATYPLLSACLPGIGTFTATSRTKTEAPTSSAIATNGTVWVVTGVVGNSNLFTTPDGITYTPRSISVAADVRAILWDGTNFITANSAANPPYYSSAGTTWTASASAGTTAPTSGLQTCMTQAPTLGAVGRICIAGGGANFYTSDDHGVTWTTRAHGLGGNVFHVCWTGSKFIATTGTTNVIYTSTDGITWTSVAMPFATGVATAPTGGIISDGNGKVLWLDGYSSYYLYTSLDHGASWSVRTIASPITSCQSNGGGLLTHGNTPSYTNGRFFILGYGVRIEQGYWLLSSTDLVGWSFLETPQGMSGGSTGSYKPGVYLFNADKSTTAAYTFVEDVSRMYLPYGTVFSISGGGLAISVIGGSNFMPFIKVK